MDIFHYGGEGMAEGVANRLVITRCLQGGRRERWMLLFYCIHLIQPGTTTTEIVSVVFGRVFLPLWKDPHKTQPELYLQGDTKSHQLSQQ